MYLPADNNILLSLVNTKLRDFYPSLQDFCEEEDVSEDDIAARLAAIGYTYDPARNAFVKEI